MLANDTINAATDIEATINDTIYAATVTNATDIINNTDIRRTLG